MIFKPFHRDETGLAEIKSLRLPGELEVYPAHHSRSAFIARTSEGIPANPAEIEAIPCSNQGRAPSWQRQG